MFAVRPEDRDGGNRISHNVERDVDPEVGEHRTRELFRAEMTEERRTGRDKDDTYGAKTTWARTVLSKASSNRRTQRSTS